MNRNCVACGQIDDHPRHVIDLDGVAQTSFHFDCHARMGCTVCAAQLEGAEGLTGDDLRAHLTAEV